MPITRGIKFPLRKKGVVVVVLLIRGLLITRGIKYSGFCILPLTHYNFTPRILIKKKL
jgi:predicted histidine transporter YuiF (NhaC family)